MYPLCAAVVCPQVLEEGHGSQNVQLRNWDASAVLPHDISKPAKLRAWHLGGRWEWDLNVEALEGATPLSGDSFSPFEGRFAPLLLLRVLLRSDGSLLKARESQAP